jgi:hypothetical protein
MNATMETAVPSVPSVPSALPANHPGKPDRSLVRTPQPRLGSGDDGSALGARAKLGRAAALRATAAAKFAVEVGGGNGSEIGHSQRPGARTPALCSVSRLPCRQAV